MAPPPPPPPPMCFPFSNNRSRFKEASPLLHTDSEKADYRSFGSGSRSYHSQNSGDRFSTRSRQSGKLVRSGSCSTTRTLTSDRGQENQQCDSDSEGYDVPPLPNSRSDSRVSQLSRDPSKASLVRTDSKRSGKWGYGWSLGNKARERERDIMECSPSLRSDAPPPPQYDSPTRKSSRSSRSRRPPFYSTDSSSTLVGSALDRKINDVESIKERIDTTDRLEQVRKLMGKDNLDY